MHGQKIFRSIRIENIKMTSKVCLFFLYTFSILLTGLKGNPLIFESPKSLKNVIPALVSDLKKLTTTMLVTFSLILMIF